MVRDSFTDDKRAALKQTIAGIDGAIADLEKQIEPVQRTIGVLQRLRDRIVESEAGAEIHGTCECGRILFQGETGHLCTDGPLLCAGCAPTWNDLRRQYDCLKEQGQFVDSFDDPKAAELADQVVDAHIAAGEGDQKFVWVFE